MPSSTHPPTVLQQSQRTEVSQGPRRERRRRSRALDIEDDRHGYLSLPGILESGMSFALIYVHMSACVQGRLSPRTSYARCCFLALVANLYEDGTGDDRRSPPNGG